MNKGEAMAIEADVTTYDSATDLLWAYGEGARGVTLAQQPGPGQPISANYGKALQYNVKSHAGAIRPERLAQLRRPEDRRAARQRPDARPDRPAPEEGQDAVQGPEHQPRAPRLHRLLMPAPALGFHPAGVRDGV